MLLDGARTAAECSFTMSRNVSLRFVAYVLLIKNFLTTEDWIAPEEKKERGVHLSLLCKIFLKCSILGDH